MKLNRSTVYSSISGAVVLRILKDSFAIPNYFALCKIKKKEKIEVSVIRLA